jgi:hypothetical protein
VVAIASAPPRIAERARRGAWRWGIYALGVVVLGLLVRFFVGGARVGDLSAMVMTVLLAIATWLAARLLAGPRAALTATLVLVVLLDLAAFAPRTPPEYDDLEAFYRTDQSLTARLSAPADGPLAITLLARPVFAGAQAQFGLAGEVNGTSVAWTCPFQRGIQRLAMPLPAETASGTADIRLHLTGSPNHDSEYLVAYASSKLGGFVVGLQPIASLDQSVIRCTPA